MLVSNSLRRNSSAALEGSLGHTGGCIGGYRNVHCVCVSEAHADGNLRGGEMKRMLIEQRGPVLS